MRRAQIAIEFIIIMAMAIIIGMLFLASAADLFTRESEKQRITALNDVGYRIQDELILATTVTDGYERTFTVPSRADRFTYTVVSDAEAITLHSGSVIITYSLPAYTGSVQKGSNTITKINGTVSVS
jgi:hypothetical protein